MSKERFCPFCESVELRKRLERQFSKEREQQRGIVLTVALVEHTVINGEMKYKVCDHCGAHLDSGETCDCQKDADKSNSDEEGSANNDRN